ncbi:hypothetical protein SLA2020_067070 [Shorea laevis]
MASSSTIKFVFVAALPLVLLALLAPASEAAIFCSDVIKDLVNGTGAPPSSCCAGASALASAATSSADKKTACQCIKSGSKT